MVVVDMKGRVVCRRALETQSTTLTLPVGTYFLRMGDVVSKLIVR